jgi:hypothetical protein
MLFDPLEKQFDLPAPLVERRDGQGARRKMIGYKDQSFAGFRIDQTDAEQMLRIIPPRVETVKDDGLIEAQTCHFVDGARINPVIVHVDFGARDQEGAGLMERIAYENSRDPSPRLAARCSSSRPPKSRRCWRPRSEAVSPGQNRAFWDRAP